MSRSNPLNRSLADGVRRVGFRKWYERELLSSHAHMLLALLSTVGLLAGFEAMRGASESEKATNVFAVVACAAIGLWALRRYLFLLTRAEDIANQASCGQCGEYGRFKVVAAAVKPMTESTEVCCTRCAHQWSISTGEG